MLHTTLDMVNTSLSCLVCCSMHVSLSQYKFSMMVVNLQILSPHVAET